MSVISSESEEGRQQIRQLLDEWITLDREIKAKTKRRKEIADMLGPIMQQNGLDECNLREKKAIVKRKVQTTHQSLSKKFLLETLTQYFANEPPEVAKNIVDYIMNARKTKQVSKIEGKNTAPQDYTDDPSVASSSQHV